MAADDSFLMLRAGNAAFASGKMRDKDLSAQRIATAGGQHPYAMVLSCSDSRVSPEHVFDAGIGELFVVRTAGNLADAIALGSLEYAAEHLHVPLLLVMGHESCGAVAAACASSQAEGNVDAIVKELQPAVKAGNKEPSRVIAENVKCVLAAIRKKSAILSRLEAQGKLKIAGATYSFATGIVSYL